MSGRISKNIFNNERATGATGATGTATPIWTPSGEISEPLIFAGTTLSTGDSLFSVDLTNANFSNVISGVATAQQDNTDHTDAPLASIQTLTVSVMTGILVESNLVALDNGLELAGGGITVNIMVVGS